MRLDREDLEEFVPEPGWMQDRLVVFRAEDLGLSAAEECLFFGRSVTIWGAPCVELWPAMTRWGYEGQRMGWSLVKTIRSGICPGPWTRRKEPLLIWEPGAGTWSWCQGELDADRVQRGLSLWGVLRHTRVEEWERYKLTHFERSRIASGLGRGAV